MMTVTRNLRQDRSQDDVWDIRPSVRPGCRTKSTASRLSGHVPWSAGGGTGGRHWKIQGEPRILTPFINPHSLPETFRYFVSFLQRVSIACNDYSCYGALEIVGAIITIIAERCISYGNSVRPSVCLSVTRWHCVDMTPATIMGSSLEDSPMTLVSSRLTSARNSQGNIGSGGAEWEGVGKIGNF